MPETETRMDLAAMQAEVFEVNTANGWFEADRHFEEGIALIHSEIAEMLEAYRDHGLEDVTGPTCSMDTDGDGNCPRHQPACPLPKPEGVGSEAADILIRFLDEAHRQGIIDFSGGVLSSKDEGITFGQRIARLHHYVDKWRTSAVVRDWFSGKALAQAHRHGLTMAYAYLRQTCEEFGIDLHAEYTRKIAYNRTRGHRHGGKRL